MVRAVTKTLLAVLAVLIALACGDDDDSAGGSAGQIAIDSAVDESEASDANGVDGSGEVNGDGGTDAGVADDCHGRVCGKSPNTGDDCGTCPGATDWCNPEGQCIDDCQGRICGNSPNVDADCGTCPGYQSCDETGQCVPCTDCGEEVKLVSSDIASYDWFGHSVSIYGDTVVVGATGDDDGGFGSGSAYVFVRDGSGWTEQAKLVASDADISSFFGSSISISGETVVVGAYVADDGGYNRGSAYVFVRDGTSWTEQAKLVASDAADNDLFGGDVSIDDNTLVVGAIADGVSDSETGSAYVFVRDGTAWTEQAKLVASRPEPRDHFGWSVSISGETAVVGTFYSAQDDSRTGSAYVFVRNGSDWTEQARLVASDTVPGDRFGVSVSISGDTLVVGAHRDDDAGSESGSAYVFVRNGTSWTEQAKLVASDAVASDYFGYNISISGDTVVVGGEWSDELGSAYVFARDGTAWTEQAKLVTSDVDPEGWFGRYVSVSGDTVVVSASRDNDSGTQSGSAFVYELPVL